MKKNFKTVLTLVLSAVLLCTVSVFGTLAYLQAQTEEVTNTFSAAHLPEITLDEAEVNDVIPGIYEKKDPEVRVRTNTYDTIVPGQNLPKDPTISFPGEQDLEVGAYVFVQATGLQAGSTDGLTWEWADGWKAVAGETGLRYKILRAGEDDDIQIIKGNTVIVPTDYAGNDTNTKLTFQAYLVQSAGFASPKAAWDATYGATPQP